MQHDAVDLQDELSGKSTASHGRGPTRGGRANIAEKSISYGFMSILLLYYSGIDTSKTPCFMAVCALIRSAPKAEVTGSNPVGCAKFSNNINGVFLGKLNT